MQEKHFWSDYKSTFFPVPVVVVSVDTPKGPNLITLGWSGVLNSEPLIVGISVRPSRYSNEFLHKEMKFGLNIPQESQAFGVDYCGVVSGRDVDKFAELKWHHFSSNILRVPLIDEFPVNAECLVKDVINLGTHELFLAEVKGIYVDKQYLDQNRIDWAKAKGLTYASKTYWSVKDAIYKSGQSLQELKK
jgi:flavin reductase (DIM6/NTAB) family NADH-FMN oxidoreductase RutF